MGSPVSVNVLVKSFCSKMRNRLHEKNFRSKLAVRKPALTDLHIQERLNFCNQFSSWRVFVWECQDKGRFSISVWGCMSANRLGTLPRIPGNLDATCYRDILEHIVMPEVLDNPFFNGLFYFQHDKSPIHRESLIKEWLDQQTLCLMAWPSKGAYLNPIKNVWSRVKMTISYRGIRNADELWDTAMSSWQLMQSDPRLFHSLVSSVPHRIQDVINRRGRIAMY
ncbi:Transposable element Tcb2 transposase, partial [Stegodyphus mimosarum]